MDFYDYFLKAPFYLGVIGGIYFFLNYKHFSNLARIIGWFVCFTFLCEYVGNYYADLGKNNLFGLHIYTLGAFIFCGLFFYRLFRLLKWNYFKRWYIVIGAALIVFNSMFIQDITTYNSYSKTTSQLIIILLCITAYALFMIKEYSLGDKESVKVFIAAILLSNAISISLYLFSTQIMQMDNSTQRDIWLINAFCNIAVQVLYIVGFFKSVQPEKT